MGNLCLACHRTLPSNLALCVNPGFTYVRARNPATGRVYVVAESRLAAVPGAVPKAGKKGAGGGDAKKGAAETSKGGDAKKGDAENTSKSGDGKKGAAPKEAAAEPKGWQVGLHPCTQPGRPCWPLHKEPGYPW